jgi:mersacidin/lichenicidin family type 2 lantibiotic
MVDILRAWKDETYYLSLTDRERQSLPAHPAGLIELSDDELRLAFGGSGSTNTDCSHPRIGCTAGPGCNGPSAPTTACTTYACC